MMFEDIAQQLSLAFRARAREALARSELELALRLAVEAFENAPNSRECSALIDELSLAGVEIGSGQNAGLGFATAAVTARILKTQGRLPEAIQWLSLALSQAPEQVFFAWLTEWLEPSAIRALGLTTLQPLVLALVELAKALPAPADPNTIFEGLPVAASLLTNIRTEFPETPQLYAAEVLVRRRLAEPEQTLVLASEAARRFPSSWACVSSLATALSDAQRPDEALACAERAMILEPMEGAPLYDAGCALLAAGRSGEAARVFARLLELFPEYPEGAAALRTSMSALRTPH